MIVGKSYTMVCDRRTSQCCWGSSNKLGEHEYAETVDSLIKHCMSIGWDHSMDDGWTCGACSNTPVSNKLMYERMAEIETRPEHAEQ